MTPFRGFVLGLRQVEVRTALESQGLPADLQSLPPPLGIILGLSGKGLLERQATPPIRVVAWKFYLLATWAIGAVLFLATVAAFLLRPDGWLRILLLVATVVLEIGAMFATAWYYARVAKREPDLSGLDGLANFPWDVFMVPEAAILMLGVAMVILLLTFVLFALWLPLVFVVLNGLTLGELWRRYRFVLVEVSEVPSERLRWVGSALLQKGGVLSRSWDHYLTMEELRRSVARRRRQARLQRWFVLLGIGSLLLAVLYVGRRYVPPDVLDISVLLAAGFTLCVFLVLMGSLASDRRSYAALA